MVRLSRVLWPRDRWLRVRNLAFLLFFLPGLLLHVVPPSSLAARALAQVGMISFTVAIIYGYEAWRRARPHVDTYSGPAEVLTHCSDPEQHTRHHPEDVHCPQRWPDLEA